VVFVETSVFVKYVDRLLSSEELRAFQTFLMRHPDTGAIIPGTGGIRKVRWNLTGTGKRGGVRIVYFHSQRLNKIYLFQIYAKNEKSDLLAGERKLLAQMVRGLK
jgi:hypothetical protein